MKKETLEEATKNYVDYCACNISEDEDLADADKRGFIEGVKWQKQRSYSEEEIMDMVHNLSMHLPLHYEFLVKEQFKKLL